MSSPPGVPTLPPSHPTAHSGFTLPQTLPFLFQNLSAYNTRLFKEVGQDGKLSYEVRLASVLGTGELTTPFFSLFSVPGPAWMGQEPRTGVSCLNSHRE